MSQARVGILLDLMNGEQVMNEIERIERGLKSLRGGKVRIDEQGKIRQLRKELERITADKHAVQVDTKSADAKIKRLKRSIDILNKAISTRRGARGSILDERQIFKARTAVSKLNAELKKTQAHKVDLGAQYQRLSNEAAAARQQINLTNRALQNVKPISQVFNSATSKASHFGSALQSLGSAMGRFSMPVRMLTGGTLFAGMYKAINTVSEGLSAGFSRYDIMKKYPLMMEEYSKASYTAQDSINELDKSVRGLPTGLDEIVQMSQRFTLSLGDMKRGTDLAIATNNAFLASMATDSQKYQGMMQLQDLMNGKKINSREWMSLGASMGKAINEVGKEFGYTNKNMGEFRQKLYAGEIESKDFLDALIKVGTGTGKVAKMAELSKRTWEAFSANVRNAFSRMSAGIVESMDEVVKVATGGAYDSVNTLLSDKVIPQIDKMTEAAKRWIRANPDFFIDTFERLKNIDWKGFARGFGEGLKTMFDLTLNLLELANKAGVANIAGKFMAMSGAIANAFTIIGGVFRGGRHMFGASVAIPLLLFRALGGGGLGTKAFGKIKDMFKGITGIGKEAKTAEKAVKGSPMSNIKGSFGKWLKPLAGIGSVLAIVAGTAGTIMVSVKAIKTAIKDMGEISKDVYDVDWDAMGKVADGFMGFVVAFTAIGTAAGRNITGSLLTGAGTAIVEGIVAMTAGFAKLTTMGISSALKDVVTMTESIGKIFTNLDGLKGQKVSKKSVAGIAKNVFGMYRALIGGKGGKKNLADIDPKKVTDAETAMKSFKGIFESIAGIQTSLDSLKDFKGLKSGAGKAIETFMTSLGSIYDAMSEAFTDPKLEKNTEKFNTSFKSINGIFTSVKSLTDGLPKLYGSMQKALGSFNAQGRGATPFTMFKQQIKTLFTGINEIMTSLNEDLLGNGGENANGNFGKGAMANFDTIMQSVTNTFNSIKTLVDGLPALYESMTAMGMNARGQGRNGQGGGGMFDTLVTNVQNLFKGLGKMYQQMQNSINTGSFDVGDIEGKLSSIVNGITSIGKISAKLNKLGGKGGGLAKWKGSGAEAAVNNIKSMISSLKNALGGEDLGGLKAAIENFVSSVKSLLDSLNNLTGHGNTVTVTITLKGVVKGKQAVISKINRAISDIRAKCKPVTITKRVNINIRRHVSIGGDSIPSAGSLGGNLGVNDTTSYGHTGGYIGGKRILYRSKGGDVPKGNDTIPAWLAPGEYVQKKAAVDFWGRRFMQRINNLDVNGAMREMAARANRSMNINRGTTITNNTTNNNNVTQNVYTSNPNFARRRSNRFVAAL